MKTFRTLATKLKEGYEPEVRLPIIPLRGHSFHKLSNDELQKHVRHGATLFRKTAETILDWRKKGGPQLDESKYGDAMMSRLPSHLPDPRLAHLDADDKVEKSWEKAEKAREKKLKAKRNVKESSWQNYRSQVLNEAHLDVPTHTPEEIANKHGFTLQHINAQLQKGIQVEHEHTTHDKDAREIALDHLWENPNYYTVLKKAQLEGCLLEEGLTERERMSHGERLKPVAPAPMDHAAEQKKDLKAHAYLNKQGKFSYKKFSADRAKRPEKFIAGVQEATNEAYNVAFNESGSEGYKVGDKVIPKIGPHKGTVHTVIHVHPTGHLNIKPNVHVSSNRYHLGAAKADPKDVTRHLGESSAYPTTSAPHAEGMSFRQAIEHARKHGHRVTYGTNTRKWHSIGPKDRDYNTSFSLDPDEAKRQGEARSLLGSTSARKLEESLSYKHPEKVDYYRPQYDRSAANLKKIADKIKKSGVNRKTIQEIFQAAKDKKAGKQDNLPNDGANEPNKDVSGSQPPQPQDAKAPGEEKKSNSPMPEKKYGKIKVKGPGVDDKFQDSPIVTPLTTMPDTASPKSGSQGVR